MADPLPASPPATATSRRLDRTDRWFLLAAVLVVEVLVFLDLNDTFFWCNEKGDSAFWYEQSQQPVLSRAFWTTVPVYPVVLRVLGVETPLHVFQVLVSAVAWFWLAYEVMRLVRNRWWGYALFVFVLLFSRSGAIQVVNHIVVTESISISIAVLLVVQTIRLLRRPDRATWIAFGVFGVLFLGSRPSNFTVVLLAAVILAVLAWRRPGDRRVLLGIAGAGVGVFAVMAAVNIDTGSESNNLYNIIPEWIVPDDTARAYFEDAGMPVPPELVALAGEELDTDQDEVVAGPLRPWKDWVDEEGSVTYVTFLATHPGWVLSKYTEAQGPLYTSTLEAENELLDAAEPITGRPMSPARTFGNPAYPASAALLLVWLVVVVAGFVWVLRLGWSVPNWVWFGVALLATAPVLAVPVIFGDSQQLERHGILLAVQVRIGLLLLTAWMVDEALARREASGRGSGG